MVLRTLRANADDDLTTEALFLVKAKAAPLQAIRATPADTGNFMMYVKLRVNATTPNLFSERVKKKRSVSQTL